MPRFVSLTAAMAVLVAAVVGAALAPFQVPPPYDKAAHVAAFLALTLAGRFAWPRLPGSVLFGAMAALGGAIEILQGVLTRTHQADIWDWAADVAASAAGLIAAAIVLPLIFKNRFSGKE